MKSQSIFLKVILLHCLIASPLSFASDNIKQSPALLLENIYQSDINLKKYWVSEKLDGVRAYWNGEQLVSREGNIFHVPKWFTGPLPKTELDGELWIGRGKFEQLSGVVRRELADDNAWKNIKYMIFDAPNKTETFDQRLKRMKEIVSVINVPHIQLVDQFKIASHVILQKELGEVVSHGGEGLMLHLASSVYKNGRSDDLLKLKKYLDAEAIVIKYIAGKGKYKVMLGSMLVETSDKRRFKIGSGFSDAERLHPPEIGSVITYKYYGLTNKGIPRFASYVRVRTTY